MRHSVSKLTHDYHKLYVKMMDDLTKWRSFLGERTPQDQARKGSGLPYHYVEKKLYFDNSNIYSHSFTVSPKSSSVIKDQPLDFQYNFMLNSLKAILSKYDINYYITFELYEDNLDMHCHGFLTFSKLVDIANVKRDIRAVYKMPKLKQGEKNILCHIKTIGYDEDQQKRWCGYLYKDLHFMCKQNYTPMYKFLDGLKISDHIKKPKQYQPKIIVNDEEYINQLHQEKQNRELLKLREEYLLYEKLRFKFEKKPLENLFSQ